MIKAVIFDFDHTLYDRKISLIKTVPFLMSGLQKYLRRDLTAEEFTAALLEAETSEAGYYTNGYPGVCAELDRLGVFAEKPADEDYRAIFYPAFNNGITPFPDAYDTLATLREMGYRVALLTNGFTKIQREKLSFTKVPEYMDEIVVSQDVGKSKPHPLPFLTVCRKLGIRTDEAVYVGDNIFCDVCGARGAGLKTVWKPFARVWPDDITPPDFIIENLNELPAILQKIAQEN